MTVLISENWRRVTAAVVATVALVALGIAIGSVSSSSGSTSTPAQTVTATRTVTVHAHAHATTPAPSVQVTKLKGELAARGTQVGSLQRQLRVTRQRNKQLRARLPSRAHATTTKRK